MNRPADETPSPADVERAFAASADTDDSGLEVGRVPATAPILAQLRREMRAALDSRSEDDPARGLIADVLAGRRSIAELVADPAIGEPPTGRAGEEIARMAADARRSDEGSR